MMGKLTFKGHFAWFIWSVVHVMYLIEFKNRLLVLIHWCYLYLTGKRSVQLITRPIEHSAHDEDIPT